MTRSFKETLSTIEGLEKFAMVCRPCSIEEIDTKIEVANELIKNLDQERECSNEITFVRAINCFKNRALKALDDMKRIKNMKQMDRLPSATPKGDKMKKITVDMKTNMDATIIASIINQPVDGVSATVECGERGWIVVIKYPQSSASEAKQNMNNWYDSEIKKCPSGKYDCSDCFVSFKCLDPKKRRC